MQIWIIISLSLRYISYKGRNVLRFYHISIAESIFDLRLEKGNVVSLKWERFRKNWLFYRNNYNLYCLYMHAAAWRKQSPMVVCPIIISQSDLENNYT